MAATGGLDPTEVRIAESGFVYLGLPGVTLPTSATAVLDAGLHNVGYLDDDSGVTISPEVNVENVMKWQSKMPVKVYVTELGLQVSFTMNQVNRPNLSVYLFGQQWENIAGGESHLAVPSNITSGDLERALVIDFTDDLDDVTRFVFARGIVTEREELQLNKQDVKLGITYVALDNGGEMFDVYSTNDDLYSA
jgi:hypothetical protein